MDNNAGADAKGMTIVLRTFMLWQSNKPNNLPGQILSDLVAPLVHQYTLTEQEGGDPL